MEEDFQTIQSALARMLLQIHSVQGTFLSAGDLEATDRLNGAMGAVLAEVKYCRNLHRTVEELYGRCNVPSQKKNRISV